jgi:hypothetical protein
MGGERVNTKDNNMNEAPKTIKHVRAEDGTIYRLEPNTGIRISQWFDDGFGNWHWNHLHTLPTGAYPVIYAMFDNLVECPDPSAKSNEPPFRPGDIVDFGRQSYEVLEVKMGNKLDWTLNLKGLGWVHTGAIKLVRRGGE